MFNRWIVILLRPGVRHKSGFQAAVKVLLPFRRMSAGEGLLGTLGLIIFALAAVAMMVMGVWIVLQTIGQRGWNQYTATILSSRMDEHFDTCNNCTSRCC
jgi:hypothetical protein